MKKLMFLILLLISVNGMSQNAVIDAKQFVSVMQGNEKLTMETYEDNLFNAMQTLNDLNCGVTEFQLVYQPEIVDVSPIINGLVISQTISVSGPCPWLYDQGIEIISIPF